ncbi:MAG TPA: TIGR04442 family protein [Thermodesulfovibrionales bacterium]|nr:TIGR04442 family protein [Thermodesulfovibrionales bacterium]
MICDLRLHGSIGPIEYFALVGGAGGYNTYFYEEGPWGIRFFSRGNEFTITDQGVNYKGTGGSFCEYMFGVEKPFKDLIKKSVANRLIMFGAFLNEIENIVFTNNTEGRESFYRLFLQGHAVKNYYFFISSDFQGDYIRRQKHILKGVGKFLKRTPLVAEDQDTELLDGFLSTIKEKNSTVFIFKLVHTGNRKFYKGLKEFYSKERLLTMNEELYLEDIVARYDIDRYQLERMRIDIMYRHLDNKSVVDEYRDILLGGILKDTMQPSEYARLNRLRTLGIRNNIPDVLFETLDELLMKGRKIQEIEEPEYLRETRTILQSLFFKDPSLKRHIINNEDIVKLIRAKNAAELKGDKGFEQILLDTVRTCDEIVRETNDFSYFEEFTSIATYFDRYDNVSTLLSKIAFLENVEFIEDSLRSLIGNKREFDQLDPKLFDEIFIRTLLSNKYITAYGRRKIQAISKGIRKIHEGDASLREVIAEIRLITDEEKLYRRVQSALKERMRSFFPGLDTKKGRDKIREDIAREISEKGIARDITKRLFEKVFLDLRKESFYLNHILPLVIQNKDVSLREDFLNNSGLDRFYLETLEKEYFEQRHLDSSLLDHLLVGGGERI